MKEIHIKYKLCSINLNFKIEVHYSVEHDGLKGISMSQHI